jgi:hypothetical protein
MATNEARIVVAVADDYFHPVTASNDLLVFACSSSQNVVIGVGSDGTTPSTAPNYLAVGSNDTVLGYNLVGKRSDATWSNAGNIIGSKFFGDGSALSNLTATSITGVLPATQGGTGATGGVTGSGANVLNGDPTFTGKLQANYIGIDGEGIMGAVTQGTYIDWNNDGTGKTFIMNQRGGGTGGFTFGEINPANGIDYTEKMSLDASGNLAVTGEVVSYNAHSYRLVQGQYGVFWRHDGDSLILMCTPSGDQLGNWIPDRPFPFLLSLETGIVTLNNVSINLSGDVACTRITGDGSGLTNLPPTTNASLLTTGTLATAQGGTGGNGQVTGSGANVLSVDPTFTGQLNCGKLTASGEVISYNMNSYRLVQGQYGVFWRHDGNNYHLMSTSSGNQLGNWNPDRPFPFQLNLETGILNLNGFLVTTAGACTAPSFNGVTSDDRLKEEEVYITSAVETLKKLKPQFYRKYESFAPREPDARSVLESGLIAQEIYYDAPELRHLVLLPSDAQPAEYIASSSDPSQDPDYSSWGTEKAAVNYNGLVPYLIKAMQEQQVLIEELKARIDAITSNP